MPGIRTLINIRTDVITAINNRLVEGTDDDRLNQFINAAYFEIAGGIDFPELDEVFDISTVASTIEYAGPTDSFGWKFIYDETNDSLLERVSAEQLFRRARTTDATPEFWTRRGEKIIFSPTPDAVIAEKLYYKKIPSALSADGDKTTIPPTWDHGIYLLAVANAHLSFAEENRATFWRNLAVAYIQSRVTEGDLKSGQFTVLPPQGT